MIPKIIHYCWFGRAPLPGSAQKCIASWRKYLPDYEIKEWNEDNFDVNIIPYTEEAYKAKKYAFVSDYARFWILYKYGGLYFDTDVEVIKPMHDIIARGPFMGCENEACKEGYPNLLGVNPGIGLGTFAGNKLYGEVLENYRTLHYLLPNGKFSKETVVTIVTDILVRKGLKCLSAIQLIEECYIYPKEYFCPKNYKTGELNITENTVAIHHYDASWHPKYDVWEEKFWKYFGLKNQFVISKFFTLLRIIKTKVR